VVGAVRLFVAVPLTEEARHHMSHLLDGASLPGRPHHPEKWHITLRFLGEVDEVARDRVAACLDEADLGEPFRVRWGGLDAFPRASKANVLWVGVEHGFDHLEALHARVERALDGAGFPPEDRPFRPHLTLSRIRPQQDVTELVERTESLGVTMPVDRVTLYRSHLGRGAARYEELESFPLG
jgi:2'-5' RNA ligase